MSETRDAIERATVRASATSWSEEADDGLRELVKRQAEYIEHLEAKVERLELQQTPERTNAIRQAFGIVG